MQLDKKNRPTLRLAEFLGHLFAGVLIFVVIAFAGLAVGWVSEYLVSVKSPSLVTSTLSIVEAIILVLDGILLLIFIVRSAIKYYFAFSHKEVRHD